MLNQSNNTVTAASADNRFAAVRTAGDFAAQVIARADLSRKGSKVAVEKLTNPEAKEFAGYELLEAETVVSVLEQLGAVVPPMNAETKAALDQIVKAPAGRAFDTSYMTAEYENHAFLRDLAEAYLRNSDAGTRDAAEQHGRQLAQIAFYAFTEHTGITHRILKGIAS
jgi:hypothetical protein